MKEWKRGLEENLVKKEPGNRMRKKIKERSGNKKGRGRGMREARIKKKIKNSCEKEKG